MATIKGAWKFNDKLVCNIEDWFVENVNFTAALVTLDDAWSEIIEVKRHTYDEIDMWGDGVGEPVIDVNYGNERAYTNGWYYSIYQTIDFGQEEQEVSDNFYSWLTANAAKLPSNYVISRKTLQDINDTIRNCTLPKPLEDMEYIPTSDIPSKIENIYDQGTQQGIQQGTQDEYNRFWDVITQNGERTFYEQAFSYWDCEYLRPNRKIIPGNDTRPMNIFTSNPSLKSIENEYFDFSNVAITHGTGSYCYYRTFYNCPNLEIIEDINMPAGKYDLTFAWCKKLHTIEVLRLEPETIIVSNAVFSNCTELRNLTIEGTIGQNNFDVHWSKYLSKKSIISIINALQITPAISNPTITLSLDAVDSAFGDASVAGSTTDEWFDLVNSRPNWTIALMDANGNIQ